MNISHYLIATSFARTSMRKQFDYTSEGVSEQEAGRRQTATTAIRRRLSTTLHAMASALEPQPVVPGCTPGHQST